MEKQSAVVIGAGVAGLATATLLSREGYQVTIIVKTKETYTSSRRRRNVTTLSGRRTRPTSESLTQGLDTT